jgi:hypothetical protein
LLKIGERKFSDEMVFANAIAEELTNIMGEVLTPTELEERVRRSQLNANAWKEVNRGISYEVYGDEIWLHVNTMFLKGSSELKDVVKDGLGKLAQELNSNPALKDIKSINGESWIVYKHWKYLRDELGFRIIRLDKDKKEGVSQISREDFLNRYLKQ